MSEIVFKFFVRLLEKLLLKDSLVTTNYNQPLQIDGKINCCYVFTISEDTEVEILDDLTAVKSKSQVVYDIYWQNTNNTSVLTVKHDGVTLTPAGDIADVTKQNHIVFTRHPASGSSIGSVLELVNSVSLDKR